ISPLQSWNFAEALSRLFFLADSKSFQEVRILGSIRLIVPSAFLMLWNAGDEDEQRVFRGKLCRGNCPREA
ncbi:hypothetical protein A2U01_0023393, partial [Trifolium medium]|nr:hypothetical protein [Trifolium medium]